MTGSVFFANYGWYYETGITFVAVVGFYENDMMRIAIPDKTFAFAPLCSPNNKQRVEAEIKRQIRSLWPEICPPPKAQESHKLIARLLLDVDNMQAHFLSIAIDPYNQERSFMATRLRALHRRGSLSVRKYNQELKAYIKKYSAPDWPITRNYAASLFRARRQRKREQKTPTYKKMRQQLMKVVRQMEAEMGHSKPPGTCGTVGCNTNFYDYFPPDEQE